MRGKNGDWNIDYMAQRKIAVAISVLLILLSVGSFVVRGLNFGIDFTGGTIVEVAYAQGVELSEVRARLTEAGFPDAVAQHFGTAQDVLIRIPPREVAQAELSQQVLAALRAGEAEVDLRRVEFVGPQVGEELVEKGILAFIYALVGILIYVAFRFQFKFAVGAVAATVHDVVIMIGFFSITGLEFDLTVVAAVLALIGYTINDTVVIFDRIRENFLRMRKSEPVEVINGSINQTMSRTLLTSGTTLLVLFALFIFGGDTISGFALGLIVGIFVGTFSSIYIASAMTLWLGITKADMMPPEKEGADIEGRP